MNTIKGKVAPLVKIYGGKTYLCKKILSCMHYKPVYVDAMCGGLSMILGCDEEFDEVFAFDINHELINLYKVIQLAPLPFQLELTQLAVHNRKTFHYTFLHWKDKNPQYLSEFNRAIRFLVLNRFSRSADHKTFGWSDRLRRGVPEYLSAWQTCIASIPEISHKVRNVIFDCGDYWDLICKYDLHKRDDAVFIFDPPYVSSARVSKKQYIQEWNDDDHLSLIDYVKNDIAGISYVSGYKSNLYLNKSQLGEPNWEFSYKCSHSSSKTKPDRVECLWKIKGNLT